MLLGHTRVEDDLKQQITQFVTQLFHVSPLDRVVQGLRTVDDHGREPLPIGVERGQDLLRLDRRLPEHVLEEHVPGALTRNDRPVQVPVSAPGSNGDGGSVSAKGSPEKKPLRGIAMIGALSVDGLHKKVDALLELAKDTEAITHPDGMMVRISREELGKLVNCSREMAGKVLKNLEAQGLVQIDGRNIVINNTR